MALFLGAILLGGYWELFLDKRLMLILALVPSDTCWDP